VDLCEKKGHDKWEKVRHKPRRGKIGNREKGTASSSELATVEKEEVHPGYQERKDYVGGENVGEVNVLVREKGDARSEKAITGRITQPFKLDG